MSPRLKTIGLVAILVALVIAGSMIGIAWEIDNSPAHAPSAAPEFPSSITVYEKGLPLGYNWSLLSYFGTTGGLLINNSFAPTGQAISVSDIAQLRAISAQFPSGQIVGTKLVWAGNYVGFPVNGFDFGPTLANANYTVNSTYTFYFYPEVNITFVVSGVPSAVKWDFNTTQVIGSIFGPQTLMSKDTLGGNMSFTVSALPGANISFSFFINPSSGYVANLPNGHFYVRTTNNPVTIDVHKQAYWYTLPAYWFNEGKSLAIDYWWAILIIVIGGFVGYLFEVGLPSREEIRKELRKAEKKVKK